MIIAAIQYMSTKKKIKLVLLSLALLGLVGTALFVKNKNNDGEIFGARGLFSPGRGGLLTPQSSLVQVEYDFGVVDIPTERAGAASSSTGFEFGRHLITSATAFTVATTSTGFALTANESGRVKGCEFSLQAIPTTGSVAVMIQKNGTLQTSAYCRLPRSSTFATNGGTDDVATVETITDDITFVAGDRFGLIASSSGLNAATFDGVAKLILYIDQ